VPSPLPRNTPDACAQVVADDEIGNAVAVHVAHGERVGAGAGRVIDLRLESAVAIAEIDADRSGAAAVVIDERESSLPSRLKSPVDDRLRIGAGGQSRLFEFDGAAARSLRRQGRTHEQRTDKRNRQQARHVNSSFARRHIPRVQRIA